jgi:hypothetical protein
MAVLRAAVLLHSVAAVVLILATDHARVRRHLGQGHRASDDPGHGVGGLGARLNHPLWHEEMTKGR